MRRRYALLSVILSISTLVACQTAGAPFAGVARLFNVRSGAAQNLLLAAAPGSPIAIAGGASHIVLGDVNNDGIPDLAVAGTRDSSITLLLGQGDGQFHQAPQGPISLPYAPSEMVLRDINADGNLDLAVASHGSYGVTLLMGDGTGGFSVTASSPVQMKDGQQAHTHGLLLGDLNGDGALDLVTVNSDPDNDVSVALADGHGGYVLVAGSPFPVGPSPYPAALDDVNGDGHLDIISTTTDRSKVNQDASRALTLLAGNGRGGFSGSQLPLRAAHPWFVAVSDVNGDQRSDILATHAERSELTVLQANGSGDFIEAAGSPFDLGHSAWYMGVVDMNGDGKLDVVAAAADGVRVMLGDGQGGFQAAPGSPFPTGRGAWRLAVGDMNGDGRPDVATSNVESGDVTVLLGS
jgi:hypothetical protein